MRHVGTIFRRELAGYFATPVAYVFLVVFLALAGALTFFMGDFFERGQADLQPFFTFVPWLYLFLIPAIAMRLWAEERKTGTIETLLTLPIGVTEAVLGKFFAAWCFTGIALALTFPLWITVNYLGDPDNGVIVAGWLGSFLMGGALLAIGSCFSAVTKNQVIAFVLTSAVCVIFTLSGSPVVLNFFSGWLPVTVVDTVASFSFLTHFNAIVRGVIEARDVIFFVALTTLFLFVNVLVVDINKAE
ncbi:MAG: ABC transporter permease [Alphaproteobacteria bacterium]|nr:ABC transporter permease [Alphaproteobacteria bacterium]